jgi:hypothetical protein
VTTADLGAGCCLLSVCLLVGSSELMQRSMIVPLRSALAAAYHFVHAGPVKQREVCVEESHLGKKCKTYCKYK